MDDKNRIGDFLAKLRNEKGYTQQKLADKIHVTNKAISNWENGRSNPDLDMMKELAKIFDVTVDELYAGKRVDEKDVIFKRKLKKIFIRAFITMFIINFLLLLFYFLLTVNSVKFYVLYLEEDSINTTGGYYIVNKNKSILHLDKLELDSNIDSNTYIELYEKSNASNAILYSGFNSNIDLYNVIISDLDEIYLKLTFVEDEESTEKIYKLNFYPKYIDHKFVNINEKSSATYVNDLLDNNKLIDKLLELGFHEQGEFLYFKEEKTKKEKITTYVDANFKSYNKVVESKNFKKLISYYRDIDSIDVQFLDSKNNIYKEFRYEIPKEILECTIGRCDDVADLESIKEDIAIIKLFK